MLKNEAGEEIVFTSDVDSMAAQFAHYADVVSNGTPMRVSPESALQDLALIDALIA